jgi:hypothetical protein
MIFGKPKTCAAVTTSFAVRVGLAGAQMMQCADLHTSAERIMLSIGQTPIAVAAFLGDISSAMLQAEARRGLFIIFFVLAVVTWLFVRLMRALLFRVSRGVVSDILRDERVSQLSSRWFCHTLATTMSDEDFKESWASEVLWSEDSKFDFKTCLIENLEDEKFVGGIAKLMQGLTGIDFLMDAVKNEIRDTLADQDIHRALLKGASEALKPNFMRNETAVKDQEKSPDTPVRTPERVTPPSRRTLPGLLGSNTRVNLWG